MTMVFPLAVAALELLAGLTYAWHHQWWLALAWTCYAVACVGLAFGSQ